MDICTTLHGNHFQSGPNSQEFLEATLLQEGKTSMRHKQRECTVNAKLVWASPKLMPVSTLIQAHVVYSSLKPHPHDSTLLLENTHEHKLGVYLLDVTRQKLQQ